MTIRKKSRMAFLTDVVRRLSQSRPVSRRYCEANGYELEAIYNVIRTQTNLQATYKRFNKGEYIVIPPVLDIDELCKQLQREEYLDAEMPKHELKRNEVKI